LWSNKQDYREALCAVFVFRVVRLVSVAMAAAMVPVSRAAEWIDSWLQALLFIQKRWAGAVNYRNTYCSVVYLRKGIN